MKNRVRWLQLIVTLVLLGFLAACSGSPTSSSSTTSMTSVAQKVAAYKSATKTATAPPSYEQQTATLQLLQAMFNAAPGSDYLNEFAGLVAGGTSLTALADLLAATDVFKTLYPADLSNQSFSVKLVSNLTGTTVSAVNSQWAIGWISSQLDSGTSRGAVIWNAVSTLAAVSPSDPEWGAAVTRLNNKVNVSYYYSVTKGMSSTDLATLQAVTVSVTDDPATVTAAKILIDAKATMAVSISIGSDLSGTTIRPLLGVNAGPTPQGDATNPDVTKQYQAIGVNMVRTHDLYGPLDMSVMYPDRSKNPALASSYNFTSSDLAFDAIIQGGFEPYFRIGDSWNNVTPPTNETERANWAAAATYIVGHYRARGAFKYVEIWNEPDLTSQFWPSPRTRPEFLDLYVRTAKAIKTSYPDLKVGGPAFTQTSFMTASGKEYLNAFLKYVNSNTAPLDFLSWHCYSNIPSDYSDGASYFRQQLDANGFVSAENIISEFNTSDKDKTAQESQSLRLGGQGAAILTGSWIALVKGGITKAFLYRGNDTSMNLTTFYGLFYADGTYKRNAHAFSLWSKISAYPYRLDATATSDALDVANIHLLAGRNSSSKKVLLLANMHTNSLSATLNGLKAPIRIRMVNDASTSIQESSQTSMVVTIPGYSAALITEDGL